LLVAAALVLTVATGCDRGGEADAEAESETTETTISAELGRYLEAVARSEREREQLGDYLEAIDRARRDAIVEYVAAAAEAERQRELAGFLDSLRPPELPSTGFCPSGSYVNVDGNTVCSPSFTPPPGGATARCRDGTFSSSQHRQGTCSHHGGVASWGG
jgi:hypothetical protein